MKRTCLAMAAVTLFFISCSSSKKATKTSGKQLTATADSTIPAPKAPAPDTAIKTAFKDYRASATRINDLRHTTLHVSFDWTKCYMYGQATITLKPHFYATDSLTLDAKGMDIKEVALVKGKTKEPLKYKYDSLQLHIGLDKMYSRYDSFTVYIDYISMPNKLVNEQGGSAAITSHKGLFFINPDGKEPNKPRELWTQGETEDNSCWFPTIDKPDQRQTEEIYMTVADSEKTLSNGALVSSEKHKDGTRTDHWVMTPGIPPYLVMMAVGPFSIVKDSWRGRPVDYYVDKKYEPYAKDIFGNTPQMIEFFSDVLKVPYAWNKYDQVVAHDYVSGAMENTTATLHGSFVERTRRELLDDRLEGVDDGGVEDIISHELFHHWFGDLVTCESWSNISLNESFATYGEYLWREHKYGRDEADRLLQIDASLYINDAHSNHDLVDFYYHDREDVFDLISYQKGGTILHMLREVVGDSAFFESLHVYLEEHKFTPVEVPMLRLAFEKVTGRDLNWFFNEWFYNKGYPVLDISHAYDPTIHQEIVTVKQTQDSTDAPIFKMPVRIDLFFNGKKESHMVEMDKNRNVYKFNVPVQPDWVDFDAQKMLLTVKTEDMNAMERSFQYSHAECYMDRYEALQYMSQHLDNALALPTLMKGLGDHYWFIRKYAIEKIDADSTPAFKSKLLLLSNDSCSLVRAAAIKSLAKNFAHDPDVINVFTKGINDSSYAVESVSLNGIAKSDKAEALKDAKAMENEDEIEIMMGVGEVYAEYGSDENNDFFVKANKRVSGFEQIPYVVVYGAFLKRCSDATINQGLAILDTIAKNGDNNFSKFYAKNEINQLLTMYTSRASDIQGKMDDMKKANPNDPKLADLQKQLDACKAQEEKIKGLMK